MPSSFESVLLCIDWIVLLRGVGQVLDGVTCGTLQLVVPARDSVTRFRSRTVSTLGERRRANAGTLPDTVPDTLRCRATPKTVPLGPNPKGRNPNPKGGKRSPEINAGNLRAPKPLIIITRPIRSLATSFGGSNVISGGDHYVFQGFPVPRGLLRCGLIFFHPKTHRVA